MKVLVLGANGKVGSRVAAELLNRDHTVVGSVHTNTSRVPQGVTTVHLDLRDQSALEKTLKGVDAVVCALSSWKAPHHDVLATAMQTVIPAMKKTGVRRIVSISGDIACLPGEKPSLTVRFFRAVTFGTVRQVVQDSEDHLRQLHNSNLDWTVLRPTIMTSSPHASYTLQNTHPFSMFVSRAAVVASIVDMLVKEPHHIHEAPFIIGTRR